MIEGTLGVIGINHVSADLSIQEKIGSALSYLIETTPFLSSIPHVLIQTCNRTEWYYSSSTPCDVHIVLLSLLRQYIDESSLHKLYSYFGMNCVIHLHRVVSGIDSAFFGETEIQGQVKRSYLQAAEMKKLSPELHYLFQKAFRAGKRIRKTLSETVVAPLQIEAALIEQLKKASLESKRLFPLLFIGASAINYRVCEALLQAFPGKGYSITNRTEEKAKEFGEKFAIPYLPFQAASNSWNHFNTLIFGVRRASREGKYVLSGQTAKATWHQASLSQKPLVIDLGVPRNVDPEAESYFFTLHNIETLFPKLISHEQQKEAHQADILARELAIQYQHKYAQQKKKSLHMNHLEHSLFSA